MTGGAHRPRCCGPPTSRSRTGSRSPTSRRSARTRSGGRWPPWPASSPSSRRSSPPSRCSCGTADPAARSGSRSGGSRTSAWSRCSSSSSRSRGTSGCRRARARPSAISPGCCSSWRWRWGSRWRRPSRVLKYRLYDLDLVVKKTAVFTIVALFLTGLYLLGLGLAALSGLGAIFAAILFVLTFNPVRRRARKVADRLVYGKRATPFEVLSEFSERVGETYSIDEVLPRMAQLLAASTGATETRVWLRQGADPGAGRRVAGRPRGRRRDRRHRRRAAARGRGLRLPRHPPGRPARRHHPPAAGERPDGPRRRSGS